MSTADDLEAAAELLETRGWVKYAYRTARGHCALGALMEVIKLPDRPFTTHISNDRVEAATSAMGFLYASMVGPWNDHQDSAEPVIELMKRTAKDLRNKAKPDM